MRISNFTLDKTEGTGPTTWKYRASIDVTAGHLFWKRTVRREITRDFAACWHFNDTGEFTPGWEVKTLARGWKARTGEDC
jgi:hypothetical protein